MTPPFTCFAASPLGAKSFAFNTVFGRVAFAMGVLLPQLYFRLRSQGPVTPPLTSFAAPDFGPRSFTFVVVDFVGFAITFCSYRKGRQRRP